MPIPGPENEAASVESLRRQIASRKRSDLLFGATGLFLISVSLLVLFVLGVNLLIDGWNPLRQTHETKVDGSGFGRREVVGTLGRDGDKWTFRLDELVVLAGGATAQELPKLVGKRVVVEARLPRGDEAELKADSIAEASTGGAITGTLQKRTVRTAKVEAAEQYVLAPDPLELRFSEAPPPLVAGGRYSVDLTGKPVDGVITASGIIGLERKSFFTSFPSRDPKKAGILSAWVGTLLIMLVTMVLAIPLGVAAGIYLEEYAPKNRLTAIIEVNIANLAGVPSIIWGLMALGLFVYILGFGRSVLTAGMTLGLLVLPIVIIATREAIRAVPNTIREAAIGLGATKWQTIRHHVLPYSMSGILTGGIIAMSRAIGETAPLVTIGALTFIAFLPSPPIERRPSEQAMAQFMEASETNPDTPRPPDVLHIQPFEWLRSGFTVMPIQLFQWVSRPEQAFHENAAAAGIVLLVMTLGLNAVAIGIRYRLRKKIKW